MSRPSSSTRSLTISPTNLQLLPPSKQLWAWTASPKSVTSLLPWKFSTISKAEDSDEGGWDDHDFEWANWDLSHVKASKCSTMVQRVSHDFFCPFGAVKKVLGSMSTGFKKSCNATEALLYDD